MAHVHAPRAAFAGPAVRLQSLPPRPGRYTPPARRAAPLLCLGSGRSANHANGGAYRRTPRGARRRHPGVAGSDVGGSTGAGAGAGAGGGGGGRAGSGASRPPADGTGAASGRAEDPPPLHITPELAAVLREAGRELASLPADVRAAILEGRVLPDVLSRVLRVESLPVIGALARLWPALRNRLVANARFPMQLGVELSVGIVTKTLAEVSMRGDRFWKEFDLYTSDLALEIVGDTMLVWLLSPAATFLPAARAGSMSGT
jgi:hypothetical protein